MANVSYRGLSRVTNPFEYPIGRCDNAIEDVGDGTDYIWYIYLDSASGYNQVQVRKSDREKLAFFAMDNEKYTWNVMPFGPRNAPPFFTYITRVMQSKAMKIFMLLSNEQHVDLMQSESAQQDHIMSKLPRTDDYSKSCNKMILPQLLINKEYTLVNNASPISQDIKIIDKSYTDTVVRQRMRANNKEYVTGSKVIIDDLSSLSLLLMLFECYLRTYFKYRQLFRFPKCKFLSERFDFVVHDITPHGNTTSQSKYDPINDWALPVTVDGLHSFVCLVNFYNRFCPLFEVKVKPLRALYTKYLHKDIPPLAWNQHLKDLFSALKTDVTSSPVMARFDRAKPYLLKIDWRSRTMSFIVMQPDDSPESEQVI